MTHPAILRAEQTGYAKELPTPVQQRLIDEMERLKAKRTLLVDEQEVASDFLKEAKFLNFGLKEEIANNYKDKLAQVDYIINLNKEALDESR